MFHNFLLTSQFLFLVHFFPLRGFYIFVFKIYFVILMLPIFFQFAFKIKKILQKTFNIKNQGCLCCLCLDACAKIRQGGYSFYWFCWFYLLHQVFLFFRSIFLCMCRCGALISCHLKCFPGCACKAAYFILRAVSSILFPWEGN